MKIDALIERDRGKEASACFLLLFTLECVEETFAEVHFHGSV